MPLMRGHAYRKSCPKWPASARVPVRKKMIECSLVRAKRSFGRNGGKARTVKAPRAPRSVSATPGHWLRLIAFHFHTHYFAFVLGTGYNRLGIADEREFVCGRCCTGSMACTGSITHSLEQAMIPSCGLNQYSTKRVLPEPSRETKFPGVHKDSCAAQGLGARIRVSPSRTVLKKNWFNAGPSRVGSCAGNRVPRANKIK